MKKIFYLSLFFCLFNKYIFAISRPIEFTIIIPTFNNEKYCIDNLNSALIQNYPKNLVDIIIVEDNGKDKTLKLLEEFIKNKNLKNRIKLIHNTQRQGALKNWYTTVHSCADHKVIINLDGDDQLAHPEVLNRIAKEYSDSKTWLTYGQFLRVPSKMMGLCKPFPEHVMKSNLFRKYEWVSSHLRTFYAELFKKIKVEDFLYANSFYVAAPDLAFMFPLLEMASQGHIKFIPDILYIYNENNPLNEYKLDPHFVVKMGDHIRARKPYLPLNELKCVEYYK